MHLTLTCRRRLVTLQNCDHQGQGQDGYKVAGHEAMLTMHKTEPSPSHAAKRGPDAAQTQRQTQVPSHVSSPPLQSKPSCNTCLQPDERRPRHATLQAQQGRMQCSLSRRVRANSAWLMQ